MNDLTENIPNSIYTELVYYTLFGIIINYEQGGKGYCLDGRFARRAALLHKEEQDNVENRYQYGEGAAKSI